VSYENGPKAPVYPSDIFPSCAETLLGTHATIDQNSCDFRDQRGCRCEIYRFLCRCEDVLPVTLTWLQFEVWSGIQLAPLHR